MGHQNYFLFLAGVMIIGLGVAFWMVRLQKSGAQAKWPRSPAADLRSETK